MRQRRRIDYTAATGKVMTRVAIASTIACAATLFLVTGTAAQQPRARWITAWGTSQQALGATGVSNATVRMIARVTIAGEAVRIRFDNAFGTSPLAIGKAYVGLRIQGAAWRRIESTGPLQQSRT